MPFACAVHCAAAPILVAAAPSLSVGHGLEWTLLVATVVIAAFTLNFGIGWREGLRPTLLVAGGITLWIASLLQAFQPLPEDLSTPIAAFIAAGGLIWSSRVYHTPGPECASPNRSEEPNPSPRLGEGS